MAKFTRRSFVAGAAAIPFAVWLEKYAYGQSPPPGAHVRYNAFSPQGVAMLKTYAQAVGKMHTAIAEGNPTSWVFQWYTHFVKGSTTKSAELARIYPTPSPWKALATAMWNTCQAHSGQPEDYFLPWHRMFVYYFETIIRQVSGVATFTLPYWNYSVVGANRGVMPPQFRMPNDPIFKSLYVNKRNALANQGKNIAQGQPDDPLSLSSLAQCGYSSGPGGVPQGFCAALDFGLHGNVHVLTGNGQNMGSVPWAAGDPVFWMHHSNIDRLWASWNAGGRKNPTNATFLNKTFVFADAMGHQVVAKIADFLDIAKLHYSYDHLEPVPRCLTTASIEAAPTERAKASSVALGAAAVRAALAVTAGAKPGPEGVQPVPLPTGGHRLYLVLKNLHADVQPEILYHVYLEENKEDLHVGTLNFFDAVPHGDHEPGTEAAIPKVFSYDVTDIAKKLKAGNKWTAKPTVTIVPVGQPVAAAKPLVGEISLVEQ